MHVAAPPFAVDPYMKMPLPHVKPNVPIGVPFGGRGVMVIVPTIFLQLPSVVTPPATFEVLDIQPVGHVQVFDVT
jgi:hypothetical protein